jgi:F-type H+-transporting ATPase subunit b
MNLVTPDFGLLFWQTITFVVLFFVLSKFVWKPIMDGLNAREKTISDALNQAEQARQEMQRLTNDNQKLLDEARAERDKILKTAQKTADEFREDSKAKTNLEVNKMLEEARKSIDSEKKNAIEQIKAQIASLSIDVAETILRKELSQKETQKQLVSDLVRDLKIN